jgi:hypothetical protein
VLVRTYLLLPRARHVGKGMPTVDVTKTAATARAGGTRG